MLGGTIVGSAVLVGALGVGDSVRASLQERVRARNGRAEFILGSGERFFGADIAERLISAEPAMHAAPLLAFTGVATRPDGKARASEVGVFGVDARFFALAPRVVRDSGPAPGEVLVNQAFAERLGLAAGDEVVIRIPRPSALSRDLALAQTDDAVLGLGLRVAGVIGSDAFGDFSLSTSARALSCFVDRGWLAERAGRAGRANVLLASGAAGSSIEAAALESALENAFTLDDAELRWRTDEEHGFAELVSARILLDAQIVRAIERAGSPALGVFTYFVNSVEAKGRATPYSTVAAIGPLAGAAELATVKALDFDPALPADLAAGEIVLTDWLANDLGASAGESVELVYFTPSSSRRLEERRTSLRVRSVAPLAPPLDDATLMPDFPGIAESEHCRDWEPGIPIDLERIRDVDEKWWEERRGTPKAFLSLAAARELFANRFGELTAVRFPIETAAAARESLERSLRPADAALFFRPLDGIRGASGQSATDFGGLFLGLSLFLVLAAALLIGLGFAFAVEARAREIGTLRALGFAPRSVAAIFIVEALPVALVGALAGAPLGAWYARGLLVGLRTIWSDAIGGTRLLFHLEPGSLVGGALGAFAVALVALLLASRKLVSRPPLELLASRAGFLEREARALERGAPWSLAVAGIAATAALALFVTAQRETGPALALRHFGAGGALLVAALAASRARLARRVRRFAPDDLTISELGVRNAARRPGRSLAATALLAAMLFLVSTLAVHQRGYEPARARSSGTGGFALIGRSALPLHHELDDPDGRDAYGLSEEDMAGVRVVEIAVLEGDDASCLELAAPERPELAGVDPAEFASRVAFTFVEHVHGVQGSPWLFLDSEIGEGVLPAVGDHAMLAWQMHARVGDELEYQDEHGQRLRVRIVGALADSVLQGSLIVSRARLGRLYPSASGVRRMLVDVEERDPDEVSAMLTTKLSDLGLELETAEARLGALRAVQDTYLLVFQLLSGLGLLLGSLGLGLVVLRNGIERRGELALLSAVGYGRRSLFALLVTEHAWLFAVGALAGTFAALVTVVPTFFGRGMGLPGLPALLLSLLALCGGLLAIFLATAWFLRGITPAQLREEG